MAIYGSRILTGKNKRNIENQHIKLLLPFRCDGRKTTNEKPDKKFGKLFLYSNVYVLQFMLT